MSRHGFGYKKLAMVFVTDVDPFRRLFDVEIFKASLDRALSQPTPFEMQPCFHSLMFVEGSIDKKLLFLGCSYVDNVCIGFAVLHVQTAWNICTRQSGLGSVKNGYQPYILHNNRTVMYYVILRLEHRYACVYEQAIVLSTDTKIKP